MGYQHVMLAIDLNSDASFLLKKADQITRGNSGAMLSVIHVDMKISEYYFGLMSVDLSEYEGQKHHKSVDKMQSLLKTVQAPIYRHLLYAGKVEDEIYRSVLENDVDLLILGHHKSNPVSQLFSPSEPIVRAMPCDVLLLKL